MLCLLQCSSLEHERLKQQSQAIYHLLGDRHVHTPISTSATRLLDIGCGTGAVSLSMAMANPDTEVIGVDLTPVPAAAVAPPNLTYLIDDVFNLAGVDKRLGWGTADLIFSRLLILGLRGGKWPQFVKTMAKLLKPSGHLEMVELTMRYYKINDITDVLGSKEEVQFDWSDAIYKAASLDGYDLDCGAHLEGYMRDAGLEDINVREYIWPMGDWIKEFAPQTSGFNSAVTGPQVARALANMMDGKYSADLIEDYRREAADMLGQRHGYIQILRVVTGRRPEED